MKAHVPVLGQYRNGNYYVVLMEDGTKIRFTKDNTFLPEFPECLDMNITYKCDGGCPWCYQNANPQGQHGKLLNEDGTLAYPFLYDLQPHTELAINANDLSHPQLADFLRVMRDRKVVVNMTINQFHLNRNLTTLKQWKNEGLFRALGVSIQDAADPGLRSAYHELGGFLLHMIAGVHTPQDFVQFMVESNIQWNFLILGYKTLGRGKNYMDEKTEANIQDLKEFLSTCEGCQNVLSFDNLALEQLDVKQTLFGGDDRKWEAFFAGLDGSFTFYVDMVKGHFALSSTTSEKYQQIGDKSLTEMFNTVRNGAI